jgi:hypothetical protein
MGKHYLVPDRYTMSLYISCQHLADAGKQIKKIDILGANARSQN